ncbi:MAG: bactofilin family protein [Pseudomonadales bacterium]
MFNKSNNAPPSAGTNPYENAPSKSTISSRSPDSRSVLGPTLVFKGELSAEEDLLIQGRIEGSIEHNERNLTISEQGYVKANIHAKVITVEGTVEGDLNGDDAVIIRQTGDVLGNIVAPRVTLEDGAKFKGGIDMEPKAERLQPSSVAGLAKAEA